MFNFKIFTGILVLALAVSGLHSCNKYPDGPAFSLLTKKSRLEGKWDLKQTDHADGTTTIDPYKYVLEIKKGNNYTYSMGNISAEGTWKFSGDKEHITFTGSGISGTFLIRRLKNKFLWIQNENSQDIFKYETFNNSAL
ncbi:hypothetical protein [Fluviicola sp.]|jgi:hypothetical protein|uniref:hypothetical protein n=1 Tax=Fluviicola sp. TaxID=1917219 RepID=UPI0028316DEE|nr:hypothetical protein [Fluviicola sp.]MDR0803177.1 hypothetical protein [Fluviicola sp.]